MRRDRDLKMVRKKKRNWKEVRKSAEMQVREYMNEALDTASSSLELADRYVEIVRGISMRCKVRVPRRYRVHMCRRCKRLLVPGLTSRVRVRSNRKKHITVTCLYCRTRKRYYLWSAKNLKS